MGKLSKLVIYYFVGVIVGIQMSNILLWVVHVPYQYVDQNLYNMTKVSDIQNSNLCRNECQRDTNYGHDIEHRIIHTCKSKTQHTLSKTYFLQGAHKKHSPIYQLGPLKISIDKTCTIFLLHITKIDQDSRFLLFLVLLLIRAMGIYRYVVFYKLRYKYRFKPQAYPKCTHIICYHFFKNEFN